MLPLSEQYRPQHFSEVVGQSKVIETIERLRPRGLGGRAYFLSGASGSGKTTIARILAREIADSWATTEIDAAELTADTMRDLANCHRGRPIDGKGWAVIVNEVHGLRAEQVRKLLCTLEPGNIPPYVIWCFTTTSDGAAKLFDDLEDAHPLLSRCVPLPLARRDLAKPFAEFASRIAQVENLDGQPIEAYVKLMQKHKNNLRAALGEIEAGGMLV